MTAAIEVVGLQKRYGRATAVHALDLAVRTGRVFGLIGPNGAGKTTTLRTLLDLIRPTSGSVRVLGADPRRAGPELRRRIGYVPGELRLEARLTGRRLLDFYSGVSGPVPRHAIEELADRLGADLSRPVRSLSKGNKQKIGLIQAFMHRPELLILDEPTSGLDPLVQREFLAMVREARDAGQTVLLSSHVLGEIQQAADDVAVLAAGRVVAEGAVDALRLGSVRRIRALLASERRSAHAGDAVAGLAPESVRDRFAGVQGSERWDVRAAGDDVRVDGTLAGPIDPFVRALGAFEVRDLSVEEPDLEESVLRLYRASDSSGGPASPDRRASIRYAAGTRASGRHAPGSGGGAR
ncbi:ABC transporter ATP-binding protein [Leucobacter zeae]|nr:ABC transporter ATP-binding protein [Leucobacter zeae]